MEKFILVIDQGTTSTRTVLISKNGQIVGQVTKQFEQIYPQPGWVEHDPEKIWQCTLETIQEVILKTKIDSKQILSIGITNQRETVVAWDHETHQPLYHAIVWQCRRTSQFCQKLKLKEKGKVAKKIHLLTGLLLDPYFSASKMNWLLKNVSSVKSARLRKTLRFGTIDSFLLFRLSNGMSHKTDVSNASRTMLMNLKTLSWEPWLCQLFQIKKEELPEICPSNSRFGVTKGISILPDGIPVTGILGDQQAALFGQLGIRVADVKCTFGTGSFILFNTGENIIRSRAQLLTTVAWQMLQQKPIYALEGGAFICGAAVQWLRDGLGIISKSSEVESLAKTVTSAEGVEFIPALTGLGAPYWNPEARGMISGLTRGSTKAHIARATLEAMALQNVDILKAMEKDLGKKVRVLRVDGGATANQLLLQIQSDYLGAQVIRPQELETTALGAGFMAGLGIGFWKNISEIEKLWKKDRDYLPKMKEKDRRQRISHWHEAMQNVNHRKAAKDNEL